jgi:hypothetical protein
MALHGLEGYDEVVQRFLELIPPEQRLAGLAPEQRLAGLAPEQRLAGLAPEQAVLALPDEVLRCFDQTRNGAEESIDCGGACDACP